MAEFAHHPLRLLDPKLSSPLMDVLTELEHLRRLDLAGTTPPELFLQLKHVFHLLESLASARIEGNHTTLADYIESKFENEGSPRDEQLSEVKNIEDAMQHIDVTVQTNDVITEHQIRGLHEQTVRDLAREGDRTPGAYRKDAVRIAQAQHLPPGHLQVPGYMQELTEFINRADPPKYDLMKVALSHHRFAWIHPFNNGNGRVVRLLTYALLIKYGFHVKDAGRLLNPAAVFCADRERYYAMLAAADDGSDETLEAWCTYVLTGVRDEYQKIERLADHEYLVEHIFKPALNFARERQLITLQEAAILDTTVREGVVKSAELAPVMPSLKADQRSYQIKKLVNSGMLQQIRPGARMYTIGFTHNRLLRGVIDALTREGFIPPAVRAPDL